MRRDKKTRHSSSAGLRVGLLRILTILKARGPREGDGLQGLRFCTSKESKLYFFWMAIRQQADASTDAYLQSMPPLAKAPDGFDRHPAVLGRGERKVEENVFMLRLIRRWFL